MLGNPKALKRKDRECKEVLIGPSMVPRFLGAANSAVVFFLAAQKSMSASGQISRCGWQADDRIFQGNGRSDTLKISFTCSQVDNCGGGNHPNLLVLPFRMELIRCAA